MFSLLQWIVQQRVLLYECHKDGAASITLDHGVRSSPLLVSFCPFLSLSQSPHEQAGASCRVHARAVAGCSHLQRVSDALRRTPGGGSLFRRGSAVLEHGQRAQQPVSACCQPRALEGDGERVCVGLRGEATGLCRHRRDCGSTGEMHSCCAQRLLGFGKVRGRVCQLLLDFSQCSHHSLSPGCDASNGGRRFRPLRVAHKFSNPKHHPHQLAGVETEIV